MTEFKLRRLGMVMEPEPGNPKEIEGVLNPAAVRGPDGELYLFPAVGCERQLLAHRHCTSAIQCSRRSKGVERLGIALEPEADYELRADGGGGCEDPGSRWWSR